LTVHRVRDVLRAKRDHLCAQARRASATPAGSASLGDTGRLGEPSATPAGSASLGDTGGLASWYDANNLVQGAEISGVPSGAPATLVACATS